MLLESITKESVSPGMLSAKMSGLSHINHMESVSLLYERITWNIVMGISFLPIAGKKDLMNGRAKPGSYFYLLSFLSISQMVTL